jgi:hypothetical protein
LGLMNTSNPGILVEQAVERSLPLMNTWPQWDGRPIASSEDGRIYTPHKAIRRIADHIVDHLAEIEALLAGVPTRPDQWQASSLTSDADLATFSQADLSEAKERLLRLGRTFALRLGSLDPAEWDKPRGENRTLRQTAEHLAQSSWYAEQVGNLATA